MLDKTTCPALGFPPYHPFLLPYFRFVHVLTALTQELVCYPEET